MIFKTRGEAITIMLMDVSCSRVLLRTLLL